MKIAFRKANESDGIIIKEMFYHAVYIPEGSDPIPYEFIETPELQRYYSNWKRNGDMGYIAQLGNEGIGAIWLRLFDENNRGYGFIDKQIPELGMAVIPALRNQGIGSQLFDKLLSDDELLRYKAISLSVDKKNKAMRLYKRYGFKVFSESKKSCIMIKKLAMRKLLYPRPPSN